MTIYKGDTIQYQITIDDDITDWKIRAEIFDKAGASVKIATVNSGGSNDQIEKTAITATQSVFILKIPSGETTDMEDMVTLEIEIDTGETVNGQPEIYTIYREQISLVDEDITWTIPS
jgi:hypothetical protein